MIQKFLDWFSQKEEKKILHEPAKAAAPIVTEPSLQNFFAHNTYQIDAIELDPAQLKNFLKEHLSGVDKFDPAYHHMTEALNIASRDSTVLSPQQKGTSINALIGEDDALALIHLLRWKTGLVCPYCGSSNVIRKNPPALKYQCQDCEGGSDRGGFDELTGY
ncbi:MAG: transposase, partial [Gammaproteobacteria bacterium]|nr:transposase [Gammaproteobacteria bacterium]